MKKKKAAILGMILIACASCIGLPQNNTVRAEEEEVSSDVIAPDILTGKAVLEDKIVISWRCPEVDSFEVQVSKDSAFKNNVKTYTFDGKKRTGVLDGLKRNTSYYIQIRHVREDPKKTYYSSWSVYPEKIKTNSHRYESEVKIKPTCTEDGIEIRTCQRCFNTYEEAIPATGHNYRWKQEKIGEKELVCTRCGDVKEVQKIYPTAFTAAANTTSISVKGTAQMKVSALKPENADPAMVYTSLNTKIATVSDTGIVTGKKAGTVKVQIASKGAPKVKKVLTIKVVNRKPTSIALNCTRMQLETGGTKQLRVSVKPVGTYASFQWLSSNTKVATVSKTGVVKAGKVGSAVITVRTKNQKGKYISKTCKVTVAKKTIIPSNPDSNKPEDSKPEDPTPEVYVPRGDRAYTIDVGDGKTETIVGHFDRDTADEILELVCAYRQENNKLPANMQDKKLRDISDIRAVEITKRFSHDRPNGEIIYSQSSSRISIIGEDLGKGYTSAQRMFEGWKSDMATNSYMLAQEAREISVSVFQKYCGVSGNQAIYESYYVLLGGIDVW